jgi:hypothetical protein
MRTDWTNSLRIKITEKSSWWAYWAALAAVMTIHFLPYLLNYPYMVAAARDNNLHAFHVIAENPDRFRFDLAGIIFRGHVFGSLLNYGSLWLIQTTRLSVDILYNVLVFLQIFMLPILLLAVLRRHLGKIELLTAFLFFILSGHLAWNIDLHGEVFFPYPAEFCLPFIWLGLWLISKAKTAGYLLLALGSMIHPAYGLYAVVCCFIYHLLSGPPLRIRNFLWLLLPVLCAVAPTVWLLAEPFPKVSPEDLWNAWRLNMHAAPWDAVFRWHFALPTTVALGFLALISVPVWDRLGSPFRKMLISALLAFLILGISHVVGYHWKILRLVQLLGLRSQSLFVMLFLPVLVLFFKEISAHPKFFPRFLIAFIMLLAVFAKPYGLDKMPILMLGIFLFTERWDRLPRALPKIIRPLLYGWMTVWAGLWLFLKTPKPNPFDASRIAVPWSPADYFRVNALIDFGPQISLGLKILVIVFALVFAGWPYFQRSRYRALSRIGQISPPAVMLCFFLLAFVQNTASNFEKFGSSFNRDLYAAQVWANKNTDPKARFLYIHDAWRAVSARSAVSPVPTVQYIYYPHLLAKKMDDQIMSLLNLRDAFLTYNQRQWYIAKAGRFVDQVTAPEDLKRYGRILGADYLVDYRPYFELPKVYSNETFTIYDLS